MPHLMFLNPWYSGQQGGGGAGGKDAAAAAKAQVSNGNGTPLRGKGIFAKAMCFGKKLRSIIALSPNGNANSVE